MAPDRPLHPKSPVNLAPGTVLLETERLILRCYRLSDAPVLSEAANHPDVVYNLRDRFPSPYTVEVAETFLTKALSDMSSSSYPEHVGIYVKPNTTGNPSSEPLFIGATGVMPENDVSYRTWELGYWLTPSVWGKGYGTEAMVAFTRWVFETWPRLNRIEAFIYARNFGSTRVLQKCGFVKEGCRRGAVEKAGEILDELLYGLLRSDLEKA